MSYQGFVPQNPAELACDLIQETISQQMPNSDELLEYATLTSLERAAEAFDFTDQRYFADAYRGLSLPTAWESDEKVRYVDFGEKLSFEGDFRGYSKVHIGQIIGYHSIRAYCLTFENVTLLPGFDALPNDHIFHVPALAVGDITQTS